MLGYCRENSLINHLNPACWLPWVDVMFHALRRLAARLATSAADVARRRAPCDEHREEREGWAIESSGPGSLTRRAAEERGGLKTLHLRESLFYVIWKILC